MSPKTSKIIPECSAAEKKRLLDKDFENKAEEGAKRLEAIEAQRQVQLAAIAPPSTKPTSEAPRARRGKCIRAVRAWPTIQNQSDAPIKDKKERSPLEFRTDYLKAKLLEPARTEKVKRKLRVRTAPPRRS